MRRRVRSEEEKMVRTLIALVLVGCAGTGKSDPETPKDGAVENPDPVPAPEPPTPVATQTPQQLYDECSSRVEQPQNDGECKTDADCAPTGCGGEVCTTAAEKANVVTTCEDRLCFKVLDTCGCHEGHCSWTLKAEVPAGQVPSNPLPSSLPPTGPAPGGDKGEKTGEPAPAPAP
jgi:eight-cysteine-cluster-containing protein